MSGTTALNTEVRRAFYRYLGHHGQFEVCDHRGHDTGKCPQLLELFTDGFYRGAQFATRTTGELSPYIARFVEFMIWITDEAPPTDRAVDEAEYLLGSDR
jgi:hypothetical protein